MAATATAMVTGTHIAQGDKSMDLVRLRESVDCMCGDRASILSSSCEQISVQTFRADRGDEADALLRDYIGRLISFHQLSFLPLRYDPY